MRSRNGIASAGNPFEQFHGVGFERSSLAELPPPGMSSVITNNVADIHLIGRTRVSVKSLAPVWNLLNRNRVVFRLDIVWSLISLT